MTNITIRVDTSKATAALSSLHGAALAATMAARMREVALFGEREVAKNTPVKTGALRASVKATAAGPLSWRIASPLPYAAMVEGGTRAHEIRPRGRFLRFQVGGTVVFAKRVRHPGTSGKKMFAQAAAAISAAASSIFARSFGAGR